MKERVGVVGQEVEVFGETPAGVDVLEEPVVCDPLCRVSRPQELGLMGLKTGDRVG